MKLSDRLEELVKACFTGIWIESHEHDDALLEISQLCREHEWRLVSWDIDQGLRVSGSPLGDDDGSNDPLSAIRSMRSFAGDDTPSIVVLTNFHRFLSSAEIMQALARQIVDGKSTRTIFVILSPVVQIPTELEKLFIVIDHPLPTREQLKEIAEGIATEEGELPGAERLETVLAAAMGLTRLEAENAFGLSLVRDSVILPESVWELKASMLKKSGLLQLYKSSDDFTSLGGLSPPSFADRDFLIHIQLGHGYMS
ncbi:hypothetical protein [Allorhodopirellula heiligendammensis]|uniref:Uncharacterized protein n=1 Tax=Allorhodopirellula heiligendammensis TaxID=2714739 RepID=A0A5C6BDP1_9BACT|nr:hypothetical protein [Allorhodopirellula heiligendammensis]TWU09747.1 hypothetical protein Poly21_54910 [Allorhodopirellula heiligendammensis]